MYVIYILAAIAASIGVIYFGPRLLGRGKPRRKPAEVLVIDPITKEITPEPLQWEFRCEDDDSQHQSRRVF